MSNRSDSVPHPEAAKGTAPSVATVMRGSRRLIFLTFILTTILPVGAALLLSHLGSQLAALCVSTLLGAVGIAFGSWFYRARLLRPTRNIVHVLERFRHGDVTVRCDGGPGVLSLLAAGVNDFLDQIVTGRKELVRVAPHIDMIVHNLPGGLLCCGLDFELRYVSDGLLQLLRCPREQFESLYGTNWRNLVFPDDLPSTIATLDEQREGQNEFRLSYRIRRADGTPCWIMESSRLTKNPDGSPEYICVIINDTEQKQIENRRIAVERQYRRALQSVCEMLIQVDLSNDRVLSEYERWDTIPRFRTSEPYSYSCTRFMQECVHPDDRNAFSATFCCKNLSLGSGEEAPVSYLEYRIKKPSGRYKWVAGTLVPLADETMQALTAIAYVVDIDERRRREDAAIDKSRRDGLTGLLNRNAMFEHIVSVIEEDEDGTARHSLLMIDLDNFKAINDNFGHAFGDAVLREAADAIRSVFRPTDAISRIGGDEFIVFLEDVSAPEILSRKAGEVVRALHKSYIGPNRNFPLSCSVGIAVYPDDGQAALALFKNADAAMYESKQRGKDGYSFVKTRESGE